MYKIISFYNRNRKRIWVIILAIFFLGAVWWYLVNMSNNSEKNNVASSNINTNNFNTISMTNQEQALSGNPTTTSQEKVNFIDLFFSYCNSGDIEKAYNLISDECKQEMYQNINGFKEAYYNPVFGNGKKTVSAENYIDDIYIVTLKDDPLETGNVSRNKFQDYVTIVEDDKGNIKLNINGYIGRTEISNKASETDNIKISALYKDTYKEYEIYTFEVTNNSEQTIALGDTLKINFSQLIDENNIEYGTYVQELSQQDAVFYAHQTKRISIKYYSGYSTVKKITKIRFPNIILDFDEYANLQDKNTYSNYTSIEIEM